MTDETTFNVGDKVLAHWGYRDDGFDLGWGAGEYRKPFYDHHMVMMDETKACLVVKDHEIKAVPYPEYAADLATYRDAVEAGRDQGQTGQMKSLLRFIEYLLGERK